MKTVSPVSLFEVFEEIVEALLLVGRGRPELHQQDLLREARPKLGDVIPDLKRAQFYNTLNGQQQFHYYAQFPQD